MDRLAVAIEGDTRWQIRPSPHWQPPLFWVTIQNSYSGAFLAQAENGSIIPSTGVLHVNDHAAQWRFIALGGDSQYVIVNRATGFMLKVHTSVQYKYIVAEDDDRNDVKNYWTLESIGDTNVSIVNVGSKCAPYHYSEATITMYPKNDSSPYKWVIMPVSLITGI